MPITVNSNPSSLFVQRTLSSNTNQLQKTVEKLSTGYRINRAADDAAGLSIVQKLSTQIRGSQIAEKNIGDGISMLQTAEGALSIIQENLQRIRELKVQGSSDTNSESELASLQREINERVTAISDITGATQFNNLSLLDGGSASHGDKLIQSGADAGQMTTVSFDDIDTRVDQTAAGSIGEGAIALNAFNVGSTTVTAVDGATNTENGTLTHLDTMLSNVARMRSVLGATQNSLESKQEYLRIAVENAQASRSRIKDADIANQSSLMIRNQILQQSSAAMLSQANQLPELALNLIP